MSLRTSNGVQDLERDPLTGLYTRASANRIVKIGIEEALGDGGMISVALLDVDRFELFDEEHGLSAGGCIAEGSVGDPAERRDRGRGHLPLQQRHFSADIPGPGARGCPPLAAEKVRSFFDTNPLTLGHQDDPLEVKVSLSSGVASYPNQAHDDRDLLRKAQGALIRAKEMGRGRTNLWQRSKETRMALKTSYYAQTQLDQLSELADELSRSEASLLREAMDDLLWKFYSLRVRPPEEPRGKK